MQIPIDMMMAKSRVVPDPMSANGTTAKSVVALVTVVRDNQSLIDLLTIVSSGVFGSESPIFSRMRSKLTIVSLMP